MRKTLEIGGFVAAAVLIAFGVVAIVMGVNGRQTVNSSLKHEQIVGTPDMTPAAIKAEAQKAGIASAVKQWPTMDVAGQTIDTGAKARAMRAVHAHPRARGDGRLHLRADGHLHGEARDAEVPADGRAAARTTRSTPQSIRRRSSRCRTAPGTSGSPRPR